MRRATWIKSLLGFAVVVVGGPALVDYVTPSEEEIRKRYNPDLQRRSLEAREEKLRQANEFVDKLKEYSKSDKPIWTVWKEAEKEEKRKRKEAEKANRIERKGIAEELKRQRLEGEGNESN